MIATRLKRFNASRKHAVGVQRCQGTRGGGKRRRGGGRGLLTDAITRRIQCGSARFSKASQRILKRIPGKIHYPTFRIFENLQRSLRISKEFQKNFKRISKESQRISKNLKEFQKNLKRISKESQKNPN